MEIVPISNDSPYLSEVKALGKQNSGTLGFLPEGAFDEYANRKTILVALNDDVLCGYLLYRISRQSAYIVHLCVSKSNRGQGVARALIDKLVELTKQDCVGIGLRCRRDYEASNVWPKFGFVPETDICGRGAEGKLLTFWWRTHGHPDLFTKVARQTLQSKTAAVIDANVFFDLLDSSSEHFLECQALQADYLKGIVELCVTDEMLVEINRCNDPCRRSQQQQAVNRFFRLTPDRDRLTKIEADIRKEYSTPITEQDESDIRHLAKCIAAGCNYFITYDKTLLEKHEQMFKEYGVLVLRPETFIVHYDEMQSYEYYVPKRILGTRLRSRRVKSNEIERLVSYFQNTEVAESQADFRRLLSPILAQVDQQECCLWQTPDDEMLALVSYDRHQTDRLTIPLLRTRRSFAKSWIEHGLARSSILVARAEKRPLTVVTDPHIPDSLRNVFRLNGFQPARNCLFHYGALEVRQAKEHAKLLEDFIRRDDFAKDYFLDIVIRLRDANFVQDSATGMALEKEIWPGKIIDANIPCYVVPIKPYWASHLFDDQLARQELFGARQDLIMRREAVFYRSARNGKLEAPARILWYVSKDETRSGTCALKACSILESVEVGKPKEMYSRYKRYGIYEWQNVIEKAKGSLNNMVMCLRFGHTELFTNPISPKALGEIEVRHGCRGVLNGPHKVTEKAFAEIYEKGMGA